MNFERLITLAEHLQKPAEDRLHEEFNFHCVNRAFLVGTPRKTIKGIPACGSEGCAIGETPFLWPELVQYHPDNPALFSLLGCDDYDEDRELSYIRVGQCLFSLSFGDSDTLFTPNRERYWMPKENQWNLTRPTASEVADSILAFVAYHREKNNENV